MEIVNDKGYFGKKLKAKNVNDKTMQRATRGNPLNESEIKRNRKISGIRSPSERVFSVIKTIFNGDKTKVKTFDRVSIKEMLKCFAFNLYQLVTLIKRDLARAI